MRVKSSVESGRWIVLQRPVDLAMLCAVIGFLTGLASLLGFLSAWAWPFELCCHFRVQYVFILGFTSAILVIRRRWVLALCMVALCLPSGWQVIPFIRLSQPNPETEVPIIRVLLANVNTANENHQAVLDLIWDESPDLVALLEVNQSWAAALAELEPDYPHWVKEPRDDNFGIALASRVPIRHQRLLFLGEAGVPSIEVDAQLGESWVKVIATHPLPPTSPENAWYRDGQLAALAGYARQSEYPVILIGDLNTSPWSHAFRNFIKTSGLLDSAVTTGLTLTWPVQLAPMRIPLDHCLVSPEIGVLRRVRGPKVGSDHFPVLIDLALAATTE